MYELMIKWSDESYADANISVEAPGMRLSLPALVVAPLPASIREGGMTLCGTTL